MGQRHEEIIFSTIIIQLLHVRKSKPRLRNLLKHFTLDHDVAESSEANLFKTFLAGTGHFLIVPSSAHVFNRILPLDTVGSNDREITLFPDSLEHFDGEPHIVINEQEMSSSPLQSMVDDVVSVLWDNRTTKEEQFDICDLVVRIPEYVLNDVYQGFRPLDPHCSRSRGADR